MKETKAFIKFQNYGFRNLNSIKGGDGDVPGEGDKKDKPKPPPPPPAPFGVVIKKQ